MRYNKYLIIFSMAFLPAKLFSQDITGLWKGTLYNDTTKKYYRYEIGISEEKGKLSGFSHTFFLADDKEYYGVKKVKVKRTDGKIIIEDAGLIANNYPEAPAKGVKQLNVLTLEIKDSIMTLTGPFSTNRTKDYRSLTGTINLQRKNDFWQSALVPHLQELGLSEDLSFVKIEQDRIKEEEQIAVQKELAVKQAIKEKEIAPSVAKNEFSTKAQNKEPVSTKEITPGKTVSKTAEITAIKNTESKPVAASSKEVASNTATQEPVKEIKTAMPTKNAEAVKEPVSTGSIAKQEVTEIKKNEPKTETSKEIVLEKPTVAIQPNKEIVAKETATNNFTKEIKPIEIKRNAPAAEVANRINVVQQTVYFSSDSLQLSLYDNGEVDGDTVSVLMNGQIIMAKERLSTNAVRKTIYTSSTSDSIELVMYAENLGAIAPNTGLLVVHDGKSIYEIRFSGDLKKNASIILRRRKN